VSVGAACYPQDGSTAHELLRRADDALYRAKSKGKNRVEFARPLASGGPSGIPQVSFGRVSRD
jgi:hypothetical protein